MVKENLQKVEDNITAACERAGRKRENVTLIAVSKTKPMEMIVEAYEAGKRDFGENKAQEMKEEPMLPFELDIKDSVFMADHHYISVRLSVYTLTGGANGLTEYYAFNYSLKDKKFLTSQEILNYDKSAEIDKQIQKSFKNPDNCFTEVPTLANVTTVNFTGSDMYFTYNPLVLGAHYCGAAEILVPRMLLKGDLLLK